jgi:hydroxymethylpyrimidine pyrophosphatase-like HAD family hydrolase
MDGTLTIAGKFTSQGLQAFEQLATANLPVLLVTGRSAGWVSGLMHYLYLSCSKGFRICNLSKF